ncbi:MAG: GNAT family N-acyltransferase [Pseudomonadota bacterium]
MRQLKFYNSAAPAGLYRFRYKIYVEEMGRPQTYADHAAKTVKDPLDSFAREAVAFNDDEIIGCVRGNYLRDGDAGEYEAFYALDALTPAEREKTSICTKVMVDKPYRGTSLAMKLLFLQYRMALDAGMDICIVDCNPPIDRQNARLGFKPLFEKDHPEYGRVHVMRLDMRDEAHLQAIRSPLAGILRLHRQGHSTEKPTRPAIAAE